MGISVADFRKNNNYTAMRIFRDEQVHFSGKGSSSANQACRELKPNIIDLNGDDSFDLVSVGKGSKFSEPCLNMGLTELRRLAELKGSEVLTQSDGLELQVEDLGWREESWHYAVTPFRENLRSIETVIHGAVPHGLPGLQWAVDVVNNQFLIYTPK